MQKRRSSGLGRGTGRRPRWGRGGGGAASLVVGRRLLPAAVLEGGGAEQGSGARPLAGHEEAAGLVADAGCAGRGSCLLPPCVRAGAGALVGHLAC